MTSRKSVVIGLFLALFNCQKCLGLPSGSNFFFPPVIIFVFWLCHLACRILVLQPEMEPEPLAVKA